MTICDYLYVILRGIFSSPVWADQFSDLCPCYIYSSRVDIYMSWPVFGEFWWHPLVGLAEMVGLGSLDPLDPSAHYIPLDHLTDWPLYVCNKDQPTQSVSSQSFYPCFVLSVLSVRSIASWKQWKLASNRLEAGFTCPYTLGLGEFFKVKIMTRLTCFLM